MIHISVLVMGLQCLNVLGVDDHDTSRRGMHCISTYLSWIFKSISAATANTTASYVNTKVNPLKKLLPCVAGSANGNTITLIFNSLK